MISPQNQRMKQQAWKNLKKLVFQCSFWAGFSCNMAGECRRCIGTGVPLPDPEPGGDECHAGRYQRGGPCFPPLLCAWRLAPRPFAMRSFLIPYASPPVLLCSGFWKRGCPLGSNSLSPCGGKHQPHRCPGAPRTQPSHSYLQCVFAYSSLNLCIEFKARRDC